MKVSSEQSNNGQYLVLCSAFFYGLNPFFGKLLFEEGLSAEVVSLYRFIIPAMLFVFFLRTKKEHTTEALRTFVLGIASAIAIYSFFNALQVLPAATAILIYYTYPVFSVLIGWATYKRAPSQNALISAAIIAIAASLTVSPQTIPSHLLVYVVSCFLAPIVVATQVQYLSQPKQRIPTSNRMAWTTLGHIAVLLPIAIYSRPEQILPVSAIGFGALIGIALFAAAIPQILFMLGAPKSNVDKNALIGALELVVALLTGTLFLGEALSQFEITAMVLIVLALFIKQVHKQPIVEVLDPKIGG